MNKVKLKISSSKVVRYLRDFSIVVAGIAVTLLVQSWLVGRNEQKDIKLYLKAVKMELETNLQFIDSQTVYLEEWTAYARYLQSHDKKMLNPDSIRHYGYPGLGQLPAIVFQTSAFEMFKISGTMRLMDDKNLLQSVLDTYSQFERMKSEFESYYQFKIEEAKKEIQLMNDGKQVDVPLYSFFVDYAANFGLLENCTGFAIDLKKITADIDKVLK